MAIAPNNLYRLTASSLLSNIILAY